MSDDTPKFEISIESPSNIFQTHLKDPFNRRILFSSPFGTGKTYFLTRFFKESHQYECFHLFPVNYSVSTNEDIFELIKYDLLFRLLATSVEFDHVEFGKWFAFESYIHFKPSEFFKSIFSVVNKLGQAIPGEVGEKLIAAYKEVNGNYENFIKSVQKDENKEVIAYLQAQTQIKGSINEHDQITELISNLIAKIINSGKEVVLVIDDLDRIDPEHIFRLLNIFAAHLDINKEKNKFEISKVIFVCDENNVRNIFHSKYGTNVDYTGYIDKFFSKKVFEFDNTDGISKFLYQLSTTIRVNGDDDESSFVKYLFAFKEINHFNVSVRRILKYLVAYKALTIRSLEKLYKVNYPFDRYVTTYSFIPSDDFDSNYDFINIAKFLYFVVGGSKQLIEILSKASENNPEIYVGDLSSGNDEAISIRQIIGDAVAMLAIESHNYNIDKNSSQGLELAIEVDNIKYEYTLIYSNLNYRNGPRAAGFNAYIKKAHRQNQEIKAVKLNFFKILLLAVLKLESYKI